MISINRNRFDEDGRFRNARRTIVHAEKHTTRGQFSENVRESSARQRETKRPVISFDASSISRERSFGGERKKGKIYEYRKCRAEDRKRQRARTKGRVEEG